MKNFSFKINGTEYKCAVEEIAGGKTNVTVNGKTYQVETEKATTVAPKPAAQPAPAAAPAAPKAAPAPQPAAPAVAAAIAARIPGPAARIRGRSQKNFFMLYIM